MTTIAAALQAARQHIEVSEARLLLRHLLGCGSTWIEAHRDDPLATDVEQAYKALVARRAAGEPIAYLLQSREFYGRSFGVAPGVLIPRPETELIVDVVLQKFACDADIRILDLGTGSGCLAITLALELPNAKVSAVDVSPAALAIARENAAQLRASVRWFESDWFSALAGEQFDLIVSNPPYIALGDAHMAQGDLRFEPSGALASGADGLDAIRWIAGKAQGFMGMNGLLLMEHGFDQADSVRALLASHEFALIEQHRDLAGIVRVSGGTRCGQDINPA